MNLIDDVLRGIDNNRLLKNRREGPTPLGDLIEAYEKLASVDDSLPRLAEETTVGEFKDALRHVPSQNLVVMLYNYLRATSGQTNPFTYEEHPKELEDRRLRHWVIKVTAGTAVAMLVLVTGAVIATGAKNGGLGDDSLASGILSTAVEVLKVVISGDVK